MQTVLVIDDDSTILMLLSAYLSQEGFRPLTASDGRTGLEVFAAERPDVVLCDLTMPGLGGLGVLAEVRRRSPLTPFVVFSGSNDINLAVEALRQGAWDYLLKPLPGLELLPPLLARMEERAVFLREKELYQTRLEEQIRIRTAQLTRQLKEKDALLAEVHHRVKNNLQVILVLLSLQHDHSTDPWVRAALEASQNRIHTLALVQEEMHDADHATRVGALNYATGLVHHLLSVHGLTAEVDLSLDIEDLNLSPGTAFACGLVVNELLAALAQLGPIDHSWSLSFGLRGTEHRQVELTMIESRGAWLSWVPAPEKPSLGWDLVSALALQGGGRLEWDPTVPERIRVLLS